MAAWRTAEARDDEAIVAMSLALFVEDPSPERVTADGVRATLAALREAPVRGRAAVLDAGGAVVGYALLISFWSNELGGEVCTLDEIYVAPAWRGRGLGTALVEALRRGAPLWPSAPVAVELEITPTNRRARALYERLGFKVKRNATMRLVPAD